MLPERYLKDGLDVAKGLRVFGQPVEGFNRDELLAVIGNLVNRFYYNSTRSLELHARPATSVRPK